MEFHPHSLRLRPLFTVNSDMNQKHKHMCWGFYWNISSWNVITEVRFTFLFFSFFLSLKYRFLARLMYVHSSQWYVSYQYSGSKAVESCDLWSSTETKGSPSGCPWKAVCKKGERLNTSRKSKKQHLNSFDSYYRGTSDRTNLCQAFCKVLSSAFPYCWARQLHACLPSGSHSSLPSLLCFS